jgi:hypothetical protein
VGYSGTVAVGTFTSSGKPDLILDNADQVSMVTMRNTSTLGTITFGEPVGLGVAGKNPVVANFNGDTYLDIAFEHVNANGIGYVGILPGTGDGRFGAALTTPENILGTLATGDLNLDGKPDLVATAGFNLVILLGKGDGSFKTHYQSQPCCTNYTVIRDVTGDGVPDILADCDYPAPAPRRAICTMVGAGDGTFGNPIAAPYSNVGEATNGIAVGDFNGDGKPDLAVTQNVSGSFSVLLQIATARLSGSSRVSFGVVPMGQAATRDAVVTNIGAGELRLSLLATESPDFAIVNDPCSGATLAASASCTVTIRFTPAILPPETANLVVIGDGRRTTLTIPLNGMGTRGIAPPTGPTVRFRPRTLSAYNTPSLPSPGSGGGELPLVPSPASGGGKFMAGIAAALLSFF